MRVWFLIVFIFSASEIFSHGGGLDRYGCHKETKTGGYHCHRSSGWGGSLPNSTNPSVLEGSIYDEVIRSFTDTELFEGDFIIKDLACYSYSGWKMSIVNRTDYSEKLRFKMTFLDSDKDPLMTWRDDVTISAKSRKKVKYSGSSSNYLNGDGPHNIVTNNHCSKKVSISWNWEKLP